MNLFIFIAGLLYAVSETYAQYYYVSAGQPALFQFRSDYNSFPQQQYSTYHGNQQFSTYHGNQGFPNFHGNQQFPNFQGNQQYSTFHGNQQFHRAQVPVAPRAYIPSVTPPPPVQPHHTVNQNDVPEYRGFAYQTTLNNNAVSHVLFVSGPESQKFTSRVFTSMTSPQNVDVEKARSIASDLVDPIKNDEYSSTGTEYILPKKIDNVYSPHSIDFDNPEKSFGNFFHNPRSFASVVNFYSSPKAGLFARPVSGYPADTVPLQTPPTNSVFNLFGSNLAATTTESTIANDDDTVVIDNAEAQESIMTNTRFRLNDLVVPRGKSLELTNEKLTLSTEPSATEKDMVTEKIEPVEDNASSTEASTKPMEFTDTTTVASEVVTETMVASESATNMMPTTVTEKAVTIGEPNETTDKPMSTTNAAVEILDRSVQTTSQTSDQSAAIMDQFEQTTDQSIETTVQAVSTTTQSMTTNVQSMTTTVQSMSTTAQPIQTTELFAQTTEQAAQTTDQTTQIKDQPIETTRQFVPTTEPSVQSTGQSIQTTGQADQTTVMADTTANLGEAIVTTEETDTTARIATTTIV